jgi:hypothetical protein
MSGQMAGAQEFRFGYKIPVPKVPLRQAALMAGAILWRTEWGEMDPAELGAVRLADVTWKPVWRPGDAKAYAELRDSMNSIPEGERRDAALKRIEILDCATTNKTLASCDSAKPPPQVLNWQKILRKVNVDDAAFAKALATELQSLVCESDADAIHILRSIVTAAL